MFKLAQVTQREWDELLDIKTIDIHNLTPTQKVKEIHLREAEEALSKLINPIINQYNTGTISASSLLIYLGSIHL